jgi:DNA-binding HxlR family transcriptional regulator
MATFSPDQPIGNQLHMAVTSKRYSKQVEYSLTKRGKDLKPLIDEMHLWGKAFLTAPPRNETTKHNPKWPKSHQPAYETERSNEEWKRRPTRSVAGSQLYQT